jgi:hypothetical protein
MRCEDVVVELSTQQPSAVVEAHLAGCQACSQAAQVVGLATLPEVTPAELASLAGLASNTLGAWGVSDARRNRQRRFWLQGAGLGLAAGLGAAVASGVLLGRADPAAPVEVASADESYLQDDEVFFEVSWPEGENTP